MGEGTPRLGRETSLRQVSMRLGTGSVQGRERARLPGRPTEMLWEVQWPSAPGQHLEEAPALVSSRGVNTWEVQLALGTCRPGTLPQQFLKSLRGSWGGNPQSQ